MSFGIPACIINASIGNGKNHLKSWKICEWCNFWYPFNLNISYDIAIQNAIKLNFSEIVGRGAYASIEPVLIKLNEG